MGRLHSWIRWGIIGCIVGIVLSGVACQPRVEVAQPAPERLAVERILILPVLDLSAIYGKDQSARCPFSGQVFMTGEVAPEAAGIMTDQIMTLLQERNDLIPIPPGQAQGVFAGYLEQNPGAGGELEILMEAGERLDAEAVLVSHVYQFAARQGGAYSVDKPAAVTFGLNLVRVPDGKLLWSGAYHEVQQSLSENLLRMGTFFQRGGKWLTADELSRYGLKKVLDTLN